MNRKKGTSPGIRRRPRRVALAQLLAPQVAKLSPLLDILSDPESLAQVSRVLGPYQEGDRFRLCLYKGKERIKSIWCTSCEEADAVKLRLESAIHTEATRTVGDVLAEYLETHSLDVKPSSQHSLRDRLRGILPLDLTLGELTRERAEEIYRHQTQRIGRHTGKPLAAATHRGGLRSVKLFFNWVVEKNYLESNPFEKVKPVGRISTGKPQLRLSEACKLSDWLIQKAESGSEGATACLTQLVLGLRTGEVLNRRVRDVEDNGRELWIETGKTKNARRGLEVHSEPLQRLLVRQTRGRRPEALLFGGERSTPHCNDYLYRRLRRYCAKAGVPQVCPHSLRGLHSTIAVTKGATSSLVAAALGHSSFSITARHYVDPSALANSKLRKVSAALSGKAEAATEEPVSVLEEVSALLRKLTPEQLATVLGSVAERK